ncbi:hypothetical protein PIROE2DRAFT_17294 [Piromyces sp. E2]|nr:hypothetical protein PIROE2DRAFT_17294 [Piromyces sp. E2]|eukprot:OUM57655.1 hypothetical protein PIROE2DRAFT_17294 [Piromyces sp. E2]
MYDFNVTINSIDIPEVAIHKYDENNAISKSEISSDSYGWNYYCRDDKYENGNIKQYILETCLYNDKLKKPLKYSDIDKNSTFDYSSLCCSDIISYGNISVSLKCNNDSECFSNKCIDNYYVYNEESSIVHCDIIYGYFSIFDYSYIHCGKGYNEPCTSNSECSSKKCGGKPKTCSNFVTTPSDSVASIRNMESGICIVVIVLFIIPLLISCCVYKYYKKYEINYFKKF